MAGSATNISIYMDSELKAQNGALFAEPGMNLSAVFNISVRQSLREGKVPLKINLNPLSRETITKDLSVKGCTDVDKLFSDLKK